jgi:hypothetical protein
MKRLPFYCTLVLICITTFFSCQKTSDPSPTGNTTVPEDKVFVTTTYNNTINCIKGIKDGELSQSLISFLALSNGVVGNETWLNQMTEELELTLGTIDLDPNTSKFNFPAYKGVYDWNRTTKKFTKTTSAAGIFINFPSEPAKLTNNVSIKFTTYTDGLYQANAKNIYLPTSIKASITKGNVEIVNVDATGNFSSGNFPSPISIVCSVTLKPHTYKFTITRLTNTQFAVKVELGGDCGSVIDTKVSFLNDDYNNLVIEDDLSKIEATYTKGDFNIKLNWDTRAYYAFSNPTTANLNSTISCEVNNGIYKIGDLKFKDVNGSRKVFIYYKDGTSDDVAVYNDPFIVQLKNIFRPYFGNDVDTWF